MQARLEEFTLATHGGGEVIDVTLHAQKTIDNSELRDGLATVFVAHSTCGISTIEFEPGCNADINSVLEAIAPQGDRWEHNVRNADTNGHAHVRAALIGPSVTMPFANGQLCIGTWQRIACIDFDDRPRSRRLIVQLLGV
jgi:secondary thiamine-phosphate synthase enzyme